MGLGERAHIIGWLLIAWPVLFLLYQEGYVERFRSIGLAEILAYGAPAFALPLLGYLVRGLVRTQRRLAAAGDNLQNVIDHMSDILVIIDRERKIIFGNPLLEKHFGPALGRPCREVLGGEEGCDDPCPALACLAGAENLRLRKRRTLVSGASRWFEISLSPYRVSGGEIVGIIEIWRDITVQVELEDHLKAQAHTDSLTKLGNSRGFFQTLPQEMQRALRQRYPLSLVVFDIDGFKRYNDEFGHLEGDKVLQRLGQIITDQIRTGVDSGYRYGGDEFTVILPHLGAEDARGVAERILASFLREGFAHVSLSAGILPARAGLTPHQLLEEADRTMYQAKKAGGNRVLVSEP